MEKRNVFKLTHTYLKEDDIYIKSEMEELELVKLIKAIQVKAFNIEETFDFLPSEMRDVLLQYGKSRFFPTEDDIEEIISKGEYSFEFVEINLYEVWEASNIVVTNEEVNSTRYENKNALKMIKDYIDEELCNR